MSALRSPVVISPTLIGREAQFNVLTDMLAQASSVQGRIGACYFRRLVAQNAHY